MEVSVSLDTCHDADETVGQVIDRVTAGTTITGTVVTEHGPGGGWPVVLYRGQPDDIANMILAHYGSVWKSGHAGQLVLDKDAEIFNLTGLGLFQLPVTIPVSQDWDITIGDRSPEQSLLDGVTAWAREIADEPRYIVAKMLVLAKIYDTFENALHALTG